MRGTKVVLLLLSYCLKTTLNLMKIILLIMTPVLAIT